MLPIRNHEANLQPEIRNVVAKLANAGVSEPIELGDGWHVVKVLDVKAAGTAPLADVRPQLVQQLRAEKAREVTQAYLAKLLKNQPLALDEIALSKIANAAKP